MTNVALDSDADETTDRRRTGIQTTQSRSRTSRTWLLPAMEMERKKARKPLSKFLTLATEYERGTRVEGEMDILSLRRSRDIFLEIPHSHVYFEAWGYTCKFETLDTSLVVFNI